MKTMKYILVLLLCPFLLGLGACADENTRGGNTPNVDGVRLLLSVEGNNIVTPLTKASTADADNISNVDILIYNANTKALVKHYYLDTQEKLNGLSVDINTEAKAIPYDILLENGTYNIRVVANAGDLSSKSLEQIEQLSLGLDNNSPKMVMCASVDGVEVKDGSGSATLCLKRIYSMISVSVNTTKLKKGRTITPTKVSLYHVPATGNLFSENKIKESPVENRDYIENVGEIEFETNNNVSSMVNGSVFYMYENMQPDGTCLKENNNYVEAYKTPRSIGNQPTKDPATVSRDKTCSYIEVLASYADGSDTGTITYRFFLGGGGDKEVCTNFEVERNTRYNVTLNLSGEGGVDEASWRVTTDIMGKFVAYDTYVGYRQGASSRIYLDVPSSLQSSTTWTVSSTSGLVNVDNNLKYDEEADKYYFEITAVETNVSDRAPRSDSYTIRATHPSLTVEDKVITVTQVRRIQEPIGYYRDFNKTYLDHILVKEYDEESRRYIDLSSVGEWTAKVEYGDWVSITRTSGTENYVSGTNNVLKGTGGAIKFDYSPKDGGGSTTRFGCILVTYHNNTCEHRIFVRQGYGDVNIGGTYWATKNVKDKGYFVDYPTQSGPLYQGGTSDMKSISPYNPGYKRRGVANWVTETDGAGNGWDWTSKNRKIGPCPSGYHVPHVKAYSYIRQQCYEGNIQAYIGYVHDDSYQDATFDNPSGWAWGSNGAVISSFSDYGCNPAKGTVLVTNDHINIFFPYGKGILDHSQTGGYNDYETTINEIGVGRRQNNGLLRFTDGDTQPGTDLEVYGATYWSGTPSLKSGLGNHMLYCRFWSLLKRNLPFYVSDGSDAKTGKNYDDGFKLYNNNNSGPIGEDRIGNASFVRCVKDNSKTYTNGTDYNN